MRIGGAPLGAVGAGAGERRGGWVEWYLLKRSLRKQIGAVGAGAGRWADVHRRARRRRARVGMRILLPDDLPTLITGVLVLSVYGATYFAVAAALGWARPAPSSAAQGDGGAEVETDELCRRAGARRRPGSVFGRMTGASQVWSPAETRSRGEPARFSAAPRLCVSRFRFALLA